MPVIASQDLVSIDWTIVAQLIAFLVLLYVLVRLLYRPLTTAMANRQEQIRAALNAAETASQQAQEANERTQALVDQAKSQSQEIVRQAAFAELRKQVGELALLAAQQVIQRSLDTEDNRRLIEDAIDRATALNG